MSNTEDKVNKDQSQADVKEEPEASEKEKEQLVEAGEDTISGYEGLEAKELIDLLKDRDQRISDLEVQIEEAKDAHLRRVAELENLRKRIQRERTQIYKDARANALEEFLEVNDDLRRILNAFEDLKVNQNFMDGVRLVAEKFEEILNKHGVERIDEEMVPFNVDLHDAMMRQKPEDEDIDSNIVLKVVENGYKMDDRTIRHAKVIVSE